MAMKEPCVYLLASRRNGTLYVGVTSDLINEYGSTGIVVAGFTQKYGVDKLVWYEPHASMESAIQREKSIKEWKRAWKINLIEKTHPDWVDLYETLYDWPYRCKVRITLR
jgi:putative endonuclease